MSVARRLCSRGHGKGTGKAVGWGGGSRGALAGSGRSFTLERGLAGLVSGGWLKLWVSEVGVHGGGVGVEHVGGPPATMVSG